MTKEGRLFTHLNEIKVGRNSPYANEFKNYKETNKETKEETKGDIKNGKHSWCSKSIIFNYS